MTLTCRRYQTPRASHTSTGSDSPVRRTRCFWMAIPSFPGDAMTSSSSSAISVFGAEVGLSSRYGVRDLWTARNRHTLLRVLARKEGPWSRLFWQWKSSKAERTSRAWCAPAVEVDFVIHSSFFRKHSRLHCHFLVVSQYQETAHNSAVSMGLY